MIGNDSTAHFGLMVSQTTSTLAYTSASVAGEYSSSSEEDVDGANGAFLGEFSFDGTGGYSVVSKKTGSLTSAPSAGTIVINDDGSGNLDGGIFSLVTNGGILFAIPDSGDPLLYVMMAGAN